MRLFSALALCLLMVNGYGRGFAKSGPGDSVKRQKLKYAPVRLMVGQEQGYNATWVAWEKDFRIIRNILNFGVLSDFSLPKGGSQAYAIMGGIYIEPYLPVNRLFKNYKKQNKGLFLFAKAGYGIFVVQVPDQVAKDWGPLCGFGADYLVTRNFGISLSGVYFLDNYAPPILLAGLNIRFR
jgi:hypothetical protein